MVYRTRTYIAADWENDISVVEKLRELNNSDYFRLDFVDAHEWKQAKNDSLPCTIKKSLSQRFNGSKNFILIVSSTTDSRRSGSCQYCSHYCSTWEICRTGSHVDRRSYIEYECQKAVRDNMKIIVIYKSTRVEKHNCPECIKAYGKHVPDYKTGSDGKKYWNIKDMTDAVNS